MKKLIHKFKYIVRAVIIVVFLGGFFYAMKIAPMWPPNWHSLSYMLALYFPLTALTYLYFRLDDRYDDIIDTLPLLKIQEIYFAEKFPDTPEGNEGFKYYLGLRFKEYYNEFEMFLFSLVTALTVFVIGYIILDQCAGTSKLNINLQECMPWSLKLAAGFLGSVAGAQVLVMKKYCTFDIYPSTYLKTALSIMAGTLASVFLTVLWPTEYTNFLGFATGFLLATNINFLADLLHQRFAKMTGTTLSEEIPTDLGRAIRNSEAIDGMKNAGVSSLEEFLEINPIRLYLNLSQPIAVINAWLDRALLVHYFETELDLLKRRGITRFTQLLQAVVTMEKGGKALQWIDGAVLVGYAVPSASGTATDTGADVGAGSAAADTGGAAPNVDSAALNASLLAASKNIINSQCHHKLLCLLSPQYRDTYL